MYEIMYEIMPEIRKTCKFILDKQSKTKLDKINITYANYYNISYN